MKLAIFRANGDFSQSSSSIFGYPGGGEADNTGTPRMIRSICLEQMRRVPQAPKIRETFAIRRRREIDLSEKSEEILHLLQG